MSTYTKGDATIAIGSDPHHKRKSLYIGNKYCIHRVASFSNDEAAEGFEEIFEWFCGLKEMGENNNEH